MYIRKFLVRVLCLFIPFARWRHFVRPRLLTPRNMRPLNEAKFAEYIRGKTVAVVGNGPQQIGKNTGAEIDSADIVVRFNTFDLTKHTDDYGTKTDVWINGSGGYYKENRFLDLAKKSKYVIWDIRPFGLEREKEIVDFFYRCRKQRIKIHLFPEKRITECRSNPVFIDNAVIPTNGYVFLWYLKKYTKPKSIRVYGFSFLDKSVTFKQLNVLPHFYHENENPGNHNISIEIQLLRQMFADNTVKKARKK